MKEAKRIQRAGLITWHGKHNHGSVLQAYALQQVLARHCGLDVQIIDFAHNWAERVSDAAVHLLYTPTPGTLDRYRSARAVWLADVNARYALFEAFIGTHLRLSRRYEGLRSLVEDPPRYDIYISGSDQIWNTDLNIGDLMLPYFLCFTRSARKIAYGCGMNKDASGPFAIGFQYLPMLRAYKKIMVREEWGAASLARYVDAPVDVVLDPTLLLRASDYAPCMRKPRVNIEEPYIFAYFLMIADNVELARRLKSLAAQSGRRVVLVSSELPIHDEYITTVTAAGPAEWLWLIRHAEAVVTSSFHGAALAAVFNRPFYTVGSDSRKQTLLKTLGLCDRIIGGWDGLPRYGGWPSIDYSAVNARLDAQRARCIGLLLDAVGLCGREEAGG